MKALTLFLITILFATGSGAQIKTGDDSLGTWVKENHKAYTLYYTSRDAGNKKEYVQLIESGIKSVKSFFHSSFQKSFSVYIHSDRHSLDSSWQKDWKMPTFKSECWMVASGTGSRLDMISPKSWDKESCEHKYSETKKTQQLITHELVHVFHGQRNVSPDFSDTERIDWFVEGLATFAYGQLNESRIDEVKKALAANNIHLKLDDFWTGKLKYALSGSMVMFIDHKYGRGKLMQLLPLNKKGDLLSILGIKEKELLEEWHAFIK